MTTFVALSFQLFEGKRDNVQNYISPFKLHCKTHEVEQDKEAALLLTSLQCSVRYSIGSVWFQITCEYDIHGNRSASIENILGNQDLWYGKIQHSPFNAISWPIISVICDNKKTNAISEHSQRKL